MSNSTSNSPTHNKSKSTGTGLTGSRNTKSNERRRSSTTNSTTLVPPNMKQSPRSSISASNIACQFHDEAECKPQHQHQNQHKSVGGIPQPLCTCMCHSLPVPHKLLTSSSSTDSLCTDNTSRPGSPLSTTSYSHLEAAHTELQRKYEIRRHRENELRQLLNTVLGENAMLKNKLTHLENIFNEIDDSK